MLITKDNVTRSIDADSFPTFKSAGWVEVKDEVKVKETPKDNTRKK